jgi:hypothetical protein
MAYWHGKGYRMTSHDERKLLLQQYPFEGSCLRKSKENDLHFLAGTDLLAIVDYLSDQMPKTTEATWTYDKLKDCLRFSTAKFRDETETIFKLKFG